MLTDRLTACLDEQDVAYQVLTHRRDVTALETAEDTHTPGTAFAKCVVLEADGRYLLAVVPATERLDLERAQRALGARALALADEETMAALFPDCDVGAEPPFGNLYGLRVLVDPRLARERDITFNAGHHDAAVRMHYADFERIVSPTLVPLCEA
jgi:Ala-tRNA(Pro) deacylase